MTRKRFLSRRVGKVLNLLVTGTSIDAKRFHRVGDSFFQVKSSYFMH